MTLTTLVTGSRGAAREAAIVAVLATQIDLSTALILEGLPDGQPALTSSPTLFIARIVPGCPCCIGNLTLRVTLNRILRHPPARLYISLAPNAHLGKLRDFLTQAPYDKLLVLCADIGV
ncbi:MAG: GTPase [Pseudomonadota bacterium]